MVWSDNTRCFKVTCLILLLCMYSAKLDAWVSVFWTDKLLTFYSGKLTRFGGD
jgi:hypothetical protein